MNKTILAVAMLAMAAPVAAQEQQWNFRVFLDDREIGTHQFSLQQEGDVEKVSSVADFEYRMLFVKLYDYQHENTELWQGNCLARIESSTNANGDEYRVKGSLESEGFVVEGNEGQELLPSCVRTFAYWKPAFLDSDALLNSQNGELVDVEVSDPEPDELIVRGSPRAALRYRLQAGELNIRLWYSENNEWLALESDARGGRVLRYELL